MKEEYPFARFYGVPDDSDKYIFTRQIRNFITYVHQRASLDVDLATVIDLAFSNFHLRCHQLDYVIQQHLLDFMTKAQAVREIRNACSVLGLVLRSDYEKVRGRLQSWNNYYVNAVGYGADEDKDGTELAEDWRRRMVVVWGENCPICPSDDLWWFKAAEDKRIVMRYDATKLTTMPSVKASAAKKRSETRLTKSQIKIFDSLVAFWRIKKGQGRVADVNTRPIPLIIAPSGTGKSFIVNFFAKRFDLPLLTLDSGSWVVVGASTTPHTVNVIRGFVQQNDRGLIFLDEIDKYTAESDWSRNVQGEVMSLLDGGLRGYDSFTPEEKTKLQNDFFICGCGTWQSLFQSGGKSLGFQQSQTLNIQSEVVKNAGIPYELLARFNSNLLVLQPPSADEFHDWIEAVHDELKMNIPDAEVDALSRQAVESNMNTRWMESYVSELLLARHQQQLF